MAVVEKATNISFTLLLIGCTGGILIYAAVIGKNPVTILKDALTQNSQQQTAAQAQEKQAAGPIPPATIYKKPK